MEYVKDGPTASELLQFRLLLLLFFPLLRLSIYIDDLRLSRGLLLSHSPDENDIVSLSLVRHSD